MMKPKYFSVISYKNESDAIESVILFLSEKETEETIVSFAAKKIARQKNIDGDNIIFQCFGNDYSIFTAEIPEDSVLIDKGDS